MPGLHVNVMLFYRKGLPILRVQSVLRYCNQYPVAIWKTCVSLLISDYDRFWARCTECCGDRQFVPTIMFPCLREEKRGGEKGSDGRLLDSTHEGEGKRRAFQQFLWRMGGDSSQMQWRESPLWPFILSNDGSWAALWTHCEKPCTPLASQEQEQHCYFCHDSTSKLTRNRASRLQTPVKQWLDKWVDPLEDSEQSQMDVCPHLRDWIGECTAPVWWLFN